MAASDSFNIHLHLDLQSLFISIKASNSQEHHEIRYRTMGQIEVFEFAYVTSHPKHCHTFSRGLKTKMAEKLW